MGQVTAAARHLHTSCSCESNGRSKAYLLNDIVQCLQQLHKKSKWEEPEEEEEEREEVYGSPD